MNKALMIWAGCIGDPNATPAENRRSHRKSRETSTWLAENATSGYEIFEAVQHLPPTDNGRLILVDPKRSIV